MISHLMGIFNEGDYMSDNNEPNSTPNSNSNQGKKKKKISDYYEGDTYKKWKIKKIYFSNVENEYMIIKTNDNMVRVCGKSPTEIASLLGECVTLSEGFIGRRREWCNYQRALAIHTFLMGAKDDSKQILLELIKKLQQIEIVKKKLIYIGVYLILTALILLTSITLTVYVKDFPYTMYLKMATFGSIGGFISLNLRLNDIKFEISESTGSYVAVSIYKMVFSMMTGLVSYFLIKSDLILSAIKINGEINIYLAYTIAIISGFSESLLPNIFKKFENESANNIEKKAVVD